MAHGLACGVAPNPDSQIQHRWGGDRRQILVAGRRSPDLPFCFETENFCWCQHDDSDANQKLVWTLIVLVLTFGRVLEINCIVESPQQCLNFIQKLFVRNQQMSLQRAVV